LQVQTTPAGGRPWVKHYVSSRLVDCYGRSNQFAKAVKTYIELCQNPLGGALAAAVKLPAVMAKGSADNAAARKALDEALKAAPPNAPYIDSLNKLNVNIQMVEGDPAQVLAIVEADLKSKNIEVRDQARLRQFELLLKLDRIDDLSASVAQGWKEMDAEFWSSLYYYDGRCKYARKDFTHASMAFMHVPILYKSKKDMAALSLYWAAKSMTNIEEKEKKPPLSEIQMALREATEKYPGTEGAALAQKLLKELGGA
jgi:tetratricopeptide (TPR) repeat protein